MEINDFFSSGKSKFMYLSVESLLVLPPGVSRDLDLDPGVVGVLRGENVIIRASMDQDIGL